MNILPLAVTMALASPGLSAISQGAEIPVAAESLFRNLDSGKSQTVIVYGTSLTHGGEWANAMKKWFDSNYPGQVTFINSGGPGQNSDWGLANLKSKVLDHRPDLVFIEFSYNDAHEKFKMPPEKGADNLNKIVRTIRSENPEAVIVLQIMNVGWDAPNGNHSFSSRPHLEKYNDNYRKLAREMDLPLLDHYPAWLHLKETDQATYQRYIPDGTHPGPEGSLAVTWLTIKTWLETQQAKSGGVPSK